MLLTLCIILFVVCIVLQLGYALYFFIPAISDKYKQRPDLLEAQFNPKSRPKISVIICAKNESANLKAFLPSILAQRYTNADGKPLFEVIVVNDASTDDTNRVLYAFRSQNPHLKIVNVNNGVIRTLPGKKFALSKGVEAAANEWLVFTDADCYPSSPYWLEHMVPAGKQIVGGYGKYARKPGLLNAFIRWETLHSFLQALGYAKQGLPYMAVGRNVACAKSLMIKVEDWEVWKELPSGDDDLFIAHAATKENMEMVLQPNAFTISKPKETWHEWLAQKQRHLSTGKYYKPLIKNLLGLYALSHAGSWLLGIVLLFTGFWKISLVVMAFRCNLFWTVWQLTALKLDEKKLALFFPLFDLGWMIYNFALSPYIFWKNKQQWK